MSTTIERFDLSIDRIRLLLCAASGIAFLALAGPAFAEPMLLWTGIVLGDYLYPSHELHHLVFGSVIPLLLLGVIVQVFRPTRRAGALHTSIVIWIALTAAFVVSGNVNPIFIVLLGLLLAMALAHPTGYAQIPSVASLDRRMLVLASVTAIGTFVLAGFEISAQLTAADAHVEFDHYLLMAATWISIGILAIYGSVRGIAWRFPHYAAVVLLVVIGAGSILYPGAEQGSSLGIGGGILAIIWAALLVIIAERIDELPGAGKR